MSSQAGKLCCTSRSSCRRRPPGSCGPTSLRGGSRLRCDTRPVQIGLNADGGKVPLAPRPQQVAAPPIARIQGLQVVQGCLFWPGLRGAAPAQLPDSAQQIGVKGQVRLLILFQLVHQLKRILGGRVTARPLKQVIRVCVTVPAVQVPPCCRVRVIRRRLCGLLLALLSTPIPLLASDWSPVAEPEEWRIRRDRLLVSGASHLPTGCTWTRWAVNVSWPASI